MAFSPRREAADHNVDAACRAQPLVAEGRQGVLIPGQQPGVEAFAPVHRLVAAELVIIRIGIVEELGTQEYVVEGSCVGQRHGILLGHFIQIL